jgi:hypothetical protein
MSLTDPVPVDNIRRAIGKSCAPATGIQGGAGRPGWGCSSEDCDQPLPRAAPGQAVSLRVQAADSGGSAIHQTIITAYHD